MADFTRSPGALALVAARDATRRITFGLRAALLDALGAAVPPGSDVALIGHPTTQNVGDNAIFLAELAYLREAGHRLRYLGGLDYINETELRRRLPKGGVILLDGGGNFGDLYPHIHAMRLRLVERMPDYRIVQLPQTINFQAAAAQSATATALARHPAFTLFVREETSRARAAELVPTQAILCPDMVFAFGLHSRPRPVTGVQWLSRSDAESGALSKATAGERSTDWQEVDQLSYKRRLRRRQTMLYSALSRRDHRFARHSHANLALASEELASFSLAAGLELIGAGQVLVTDRLHAHLLATLCGIPNVIVSDRFGKVLSTYEAWTRDVPIVRLANSVQEARQAASSLTADFGLG